MDNQQFNNSENPYFQIPQSQDTVAQTGQSPATYPQSSQAQDAYERMASAPIPGSVNDSYLAQGTAPYSTQGQSTYGSQPQNSPYGAQGQSPYGSQPQNNPYGAQGQGVPYNQSYTNYGQANYNQPVHIPPKNKQEYTPEQKRLATKLCVISLILYIAPHLAYLLTGIVTYVTEAYTSISTTYTSYDSYDTAAIASLLIFGLAFMSNIAGIVLMIIARVKFPKFTFAKVLMWVYIGITILVAITIAVICISCYYLCSQCSGM